MPLLNTGTTTAVFHWSGTTPTDISWEYNVASGTAMLLAVCLKNNDGKLSGPHDSMFLSLRMIHAAQVGVT